MTTKPRVLLIEGDDGLLADVMVDGDVEIVIGNHTSGEVTKVEPKLRPEQVQFWFQRLKRALVGTV